MHLDQFQNREELYRFLLDAVKTNDCRTVANLTFDIYMSWSQDEETRLGLDDLDDELLLRLLSMDVGEEFEYGKEELIMMIKKFEHK